MAAGQTVAEAVPAVVHESAARVPAHVFREEILDVARRRERAGDGASTGAFRTVWQAADAVRKAEGALADARRSDRTDFVDEIRRIVTEPRRIVVSPRESLRHYRESRDAAAQRRKDLEAVLTEAKAKADEVARPTTDLGLVGLALSGGGIRSATFGFGLLQALAEGGVLRRVDYLSTVSGGGYIGGCLSSVLTGDDCSAAPAEFPFRYEPGTADSVAVQRVRDGGRYLAPGGIGDRARIPTLVVIGITVNFLIIVPYLMLAACLTNLLYGSWMQTFRSAPAWTLLVGHAFVGLAEGTIDPSAFPQRLVGDIYAWVAATGAAIGTWLKALAAHTVRWPVLTPPPLYVPTLVLTMLLVLGIVCFPAIRRVTRTRWIWRDRTERWFTLGMVLLVLTVTLNTLPLVVAISDKGVALPRFFETVAVTGLTALAPFVLAARKASGVAGLRGKLAIYGFGLLVPGLLIWLYVKLAHWLVGHSWGAAMVGVAIVLILLAWRLFDVNLTSLHSFYCDRINQAFLFRVTPEGVEGNHTVKLSELNQADGTAPYHLINATLNLQGSRGRGPRRNSDFFLFSKRFCGSERTEYCRTTDLESKDHGLTLATAIAISGAALAPNRGSDTVTVLVSTMTLLNVRTGYWLPNPRSVNGASRGLVSDLRWTGVGPLYLFHEMAGRLDENRKYVNVSDGGHLENLGLYELLRRRCRFIVVCDSEEDADMTFHGLARVLRYAKIDCGITIEINVDDLRRNAAGLSGGHFAVGMIDYGNDGRGALLYVKSSLTGDESEDVKEYHARNPKFPHESTGHQFFNEGQFEAYRALGHHVGRSLFERALPDGDRQEVLQGWFRALEERSRQRYPRGLDLQALQRDLALIEGSFDDPAFAAYTYQIYPELGRPPATAAGADAEERARRIFHVCHRQLRFMEVVFVSLALHEDRNRPALVNLGYSTLFGRWARAPLFRQAAAVGLEACSPAFQQFCVDTFDLGRLEWRHGGRDDLDGVAWETANDVASRVQDLLPPWTDQVWVGERIAGMARRRLAVVAIRTSPTTAGPAATLISCRLEGGNLGSFQEDLGALCTKLLSTEPAPVVVRALPGTLPAGSTLTVGAVVTAPPPAEKQLLS